MATDKSLRQHYAMQGKIKNYLGKQKMVKAPKKWKSGPDHPDTELAYITKAEKDLILKADLHNSLSKGPNSGPSGIISLNSAGSGYGGPGPGKGSDGPGPQGDFRSTTQHTYSAPTSTTPSRSRHESVAEEEAKAKTQQLTNRNVTSFKGPMDLKVKTPPEEDAREKYISEQYKGIVHDLGDGTVMESVYNKPEEFTDEELEKGITKYGKTIDYIGDTPVTDKSAKEFNLGLKEKNIKTGEIQRGRNIINPITQQLQSKFAPIDTPKKGLWGTLGNVALGILAPALLPAKLAKAYAMYNQAKNISKFASTFIGKDYVGDLTTNLRSNISTSNLTGKTTPKDVKDYRFEQRGDGRQVITEPPKDVITESVQKFTPSKDHLEEAQKRRAILQGYADKGALNKRGQNTLLQMNQFLEKYLVPVAHGGFIDKPLMGRSRDI